MSLIGGIAGWMLIACILLGGPILIAEFLAITTLIAGLNSGGD